MLRTSELAKIRAQFRSEYPSISSSKSTHDIRKKKKKEEIHIYVTFQNRSAVVCIIYDAFAPPSRPSEVSCKWNSIKNFAFRMWTFNLSRELGQSVDGIFQLFSHLSESRHLFVAFCFLFSVCCPLCGASALRCLAHQKHKHCKIN